MKDVQHVVLPGFSINPPNSNTNSEASWAHCMAWLDHCTVSHVICNRRLSPYHALPKRLIDVGDENNPPFLCLSSSLPSNVEYITLSHCWGSTKVITLTGETNTAFMNQIPIAELSETFQDAV